MSNQKIEQILQDEVKMANSVEPDRKIPVIIEHVKKVEIPPGKNTETQLDATERMVRNLQRSIVKRLLELNVTGEIHQSTLSNSLSVQLTPKQIIEIAKHDDVKFIRLNREYQVTT